MNGAPPDDARLRDAAARVARAKSGFVSSDACAARDATMRAEPPPPSDADGVEAIWTLAESVRHEPRIAQALATLDAQLADSSRVDYGARRRARAWVAAGIAATIAGVAILAEREPAEPPLTAAYSTATGEQRSIRLPDGTVAQLNTGSRLELRYTRALRAVVLTRGEAVFAVVKDAQRPFVVQADGGATRAVGTEFAVEAGTEATRVTVLEGRVVVTGRALQDGHRNERAVIPGEAVEYDRHGAVGQPVTGNVERVRAWQAHRILFSDVTLADAIREYNRYVTTPIRLEAPLAAGRPVYGTFHVGDEAAFLSALQSALKVEVERHGASVVIRDASGKDRG